MAKIGEWGKCITYKIVDAEKFYNEYDKGNVGTMEGLELVEGKNITSAPKEISCCTTDSSSAMLDIMLQLDVLGDKDIELCWLDEECQQFIDSDK